jgi:hypothetical protein
MGVPLAICFAMEAERTTVLHKSLTPLVDVNVEHYWRTKNTLTSPQCRS